MYYNYLISTTNGRPEPTLLVESETTEPNGLKLSVDVPYQLIKEFHSEAEYIYGVFEHKPKINIEIPETLFTLETDSWASLNNTYANSSCSYVLMSNVLYEVQEVLDLPLIVLKMPNGSLTFNPGREYIIDTEQNRKVLQKVTASIKEEIKQVQIQEAQGKTFYQILKLSENVHGSLRLSAKNLIESNHLTAHLSSLFHTSYGGKYSLYLNIDAVLMAYPNIGIKEKSYYNLNLRTPHYLDNTFLNSIVIADAPERYKEFLPRSCYVLYKPTSVSLEDFIKEANKLISDFGAPTPTYTSSYPIPERSKKEPKQKPEGIQGFELTNHSYLDQVTLDPNEKTWYLPLTRKTAAIPENEAFTFYNALCYIPHKIRPKVYGIQKQYLSEVESNENFVLATEALKDLISNTTLYINLAKNFKESSEIVKYCNQNLKKSPKPLIKLVETYNHSYASYELSVSQHELDVISNFATPNVETINYCPKAIKECPYFLNRFLSEEIAEFIIQLHKFKEDHETCNNAKRNNPSNLSGQPDCCNNVIAP